MYVSPYLIQGYLKTILQGGGSVALHLTAFGGEKKPVRFSHKFSATSYDVIARLAFPRCCHPESW